MSTIIFNTSKLAEENEYNPGSPVYPDYLPVDRIWDILIDYVQPDTTLSQDDAIDRVVQCFNSSSSIGSDGGICDALLYVVEQMPYHHPSHQKLANFTLALFKDQRLLCKKKANSREASERELWDSLNRYLCESFGSPDRHYKDEEDPITYANKCAFAANLVEPEWSSRRFEYYLAYDALQGAAQMKVTEAPEVRHSQVIGAAQFIIFQAPTIFDFVKKDRGYEAQVLKTEGHLARWGLVKRKPRHNYDLPFTSDHWQDWQHAFRTAAAAAADDDDDDDDKKYGKECRAIAQQAVDLMALQEKIEANQTKEA